MRIGEFARSAGVNVQTIRFYEREGLLQKPPRLASGYRVYAQRDVDRVGFIRSCQEIGFTLNDIREVMQLHRVLASRERSEKLQPRAQAELLATADRRLASINHKLSILEGMKHDMSALVAALKGHSKAVCPVSGISAA